MLGWDPSGMQSVMAWSACEACHGSRVAGACCALCVEVVFRHCGQSGHNACTCPVLLAGKEQQQQQQHILTPAPAQRRAHHCSVCGAERHTRACTHTGMRAHTCAHMHKHMHTCTHTHTHTHTHTLHRACDGLRQFFSVASDTPSLVMLYCEGLVRVSYTHTHAHTHTHSHSHTRTHTNTCL